MCRRGYVCRHALPTRRLSTPAGEVSELRGARHALLRLSHGLLEVATHVARLTLELGAVALDDAHRAGPALTELALYARARPLEAALGAVAGGRAPALEAAQVALDALLRALGRAVGA